jgi:ABC-type branched-subunit amino acid transport system ATPase component
VSTGSSRELDMRGSTDINDGWSTTEIVSPLGKTVLSVRGLRKAFGGQTVLNGISLELNQGEIVLLRGENGSGKTTLLNILTGHLEPDKGELHLNINGNTETFSFPRPWWKDLNPLDHFTPERLAWEGIGRLWQDIRLFPTMKTLENVLVASPKQPGENPALVLSPRTYETERANKKKSIACLERLNFNDRIESSCDKISLGQMKRVAIARAIQAGAKVLFLDEPLSGLDKDGVTEVTGYLKHLVKEHSITLVIVEHVYNIQKILALADKVWTLAKCQHEEGYGLSVSNPTALIDKNDTRIHTLHDLMRTLAGGNGKVYSEKLPGGAKITAVMSPNENENILEVGNVKVRRGIRTVFDCLSLVLKKGQISVLEAPNGWGKSTLLDAIAGILGNNLRIESGSIKLCGKDITTLQTNQRVRMGLAYLRANQNAFSSLKVKEQKKLASISNFVFDGLLNPDSKGNSLSGGDKQKLLIEMLPDSDIYLLDEPMIGLDRQSVENLQAFITKLYVGNKTVLITVPSTI